LYFSNMSSVSFSRLAREFHCTMGELEIESRQLSNPPLAQTWELGAHLDRIAASACKRSPACFRTCPSPPLYRKINHRCFTDTEQVEQLTHSFLQKVSHLHTGAGDFQVYSVNVILFLWSHICIICFHWSVASISDAQRAWEVSLLKRQLKINFAANWSA
jgi:hypothetical protein